MRKQGALLVRSIFKAFSRRGRGFTSGYSPRRYLHMEAVFVFDSPAEHLFVALRGELNAAHVDDFAITKGRRHMKTNTIAYSRNASISDNNSLRRVALSACAALAIAGLVGLLSPSEAQAFSCGRSVVGAGCVGPRGGVAFNRNGAVAVGRYGNVYAYHRGSACYWRNNQRICP